MVKRRSAKSAYPARGTEHGDQPVGPCAVPACGKELRRGDSFVVRLSGEILCTGCKDNLNLSPLSESR